MSPRGGPSASRGASTRLQAMLRNLFERGEGSDCSFISAGGGRVFHLHKLILSQASPVLARMLESGFKEGTSSDSEPVVVGDVSPEVLGALFAFVYGQDVPLGDARFACELWELAHRFEVCELEALARAHTREALARQPLACFEVLQMARGVGDDRMVEVVRAHMAGHLAALAVSPLVAQLALDDLEAVLSMGNARQRAVEERFGVIMRWVDGDIRDRARFVNRLMTYIDLSQASPKEVAMMAARPGANESNVLMRKLADSFAKLHADRASLRDEVKHLRFDVHSAKARAVQAEGMQSTLMKLEQENAALRASTMSGSIGQASSSISPPNHLPPGFAGDGFLSRSTSLSGDGSGMGMPARPVGSYRGPSFYEPQGEYGTGSFERFGGYDSLDSFESVDGFGMSGRFGGRAGDRKQYGFYDDYVPYNTGMGTRNTWNRYGVGSGSFDIDRLSQFDRLRYRHRPAGFGSASFESMNDGEQSMWMAGYTGFRTT